jgi:hypothetical protein
MEIEGVRITQEDVDRWFEGLSPADKERITGKRYSKMKIENQNREGRETMSKCNGEYREDCEDCNYECTGCGHIEGDPIVDTDFCVHCEPEWECKMCGEDFIQRHGCIDCEICDGCHNGDACPNKVE